MKLYLWLSSSFLHLLFNIVKMAASKYITDKTIGTYLQKHSFIIDQLLHLITLAGVWYVWGAAMEVRPSIGQDDWLSGAYYSYVFLIYQQFEAIAFILTAKSVARFKEIENNKDMAEYYLIGTLLSVVSVVVLTFLLGLCGGT